MKALLYKEFKLAVHPTVYLFLTFAAMLLIPSYPYYVAFFYTCLSIFFTFLTGRETNDVLFTALLPVRKRDCVRARLMTVAIVELAQTLLCVPFAVISMRINPEGGNQVGIEPNVAFFGFVLVLFSVFNATCIPVFYKTAYHIGKAFAVSSVVMFLYIIAMESLVHLPIEWLRSYLDTTDKAMMVKQLPILFGGMAVYALTMLAVWRVSAKRFERVDLN